MTEFDTLIVGGGVAGLSTAWHLGGHEGRVALLEREPHPGQHSSAKSASILRTLGSDPVTAELTRRSMPFLRYPPAGFGQLLDPCGLLLCGTGSGAAQLDALLEGAPDDLDCERFSPAEVARRLPQLREPVERALWFPHEGRIHSEALVQGLADGARKRGVELRTDAEVAALCTEDGRVTGVRLTSGETLHARTTVLAAGGWAGQLGRAAGSPLELRPTRRHLAVTIPLERPPAADLPVVWRFDDDGEFYYRAEAGGLMLCVCDQSDADPDDLRRDPELERRLLDGARRHIDGLGQVSAARFWSGLRTMTRDGGFAIGPDAELRGLFWVAGLGGAGMGAGVEVGRVAAGALRDPEADEPLLAALAPAARASGCRA